MTPRKKVNLYRRLLREAKAELRAAAINPEGKKLQELQEMMERGEITPEEFESYLEQLESQQRAGFVKTAALDGIAAAAARYMAGEMSEAEEADMEKAAELAHNAHVWGGKQIALEHFLRDLKQINIPEFQQLYEQYADFEIGGVMDPQRGFEVRDPERSEQIKQMFQQFGSAMHEAFDATRTEDYGTDFYAPGRSKRYPSEDITPEPGSGDFQGFFDAYVEAALWSSTDTPPGEEGEPISLDEWDGTIADECMQKMRQDCDKFLDQNWVTIYRAEPKSGYGGVIQAGHDFWLTRNGHGAGFWDGDWPDEVGEQLTEASQAFDEVDLYIGDDGQIYC